MKNVENADQVTSISAKLVLTIPEIHLEIVPAYSENMILILLSQHAPKPVRGKIAKFVIKTQGIVQNVLILLIWIYQILVIVLLDNTQIILNSVNCAIPDVILVKPLEHVLEILVNKAIYMKIQLKNV